MCTARETPGRRKQPPPAPDDSSPVQVHELERHLLERALREQVTFDTREGVVRVVVGLLDQAKLLTLRLVESEKA